MFELYNISQKHRDLYDAYNSSENEAEAEEILNQLWLIDVELENKMLDAASLVKTAEYENVVLDAEIERLQVQHRSRQRFIDAVKNRMKVALLNAGLRKPSMEVGTFKIRVQNNSAPSVMLPKDWEDSSIPLVARSKMIEDNLPEELRQLVPAHWEVSKKAIADWWKQDPPNVDELEQRGIVVQRGNHLRIA